LKDEATRLFRLAASDCPHIFNEWDAANAELKALGEVREKVSLGLQITNSKPRQRAVFLFATDNSRRLSSENGTKLT
jgi:hypothetical protein